MWSWGYVSSHWLTTRKHGSNFSWPVSKALKPWSTLSKFVALLHIFQAMGFLFKESEAMYIVWDIILLWCCPSEWHQLSIRWAVSGHLDQKWFFGVCPRLPSLWGERAGEEEATFPWLKCLCWMRWITDLLWVYFFYSINCKGRSEWCLRRRHMKVILPAGHQSQCCRKILNHVYPHSAQDSTAETR